MLSLEFRVLSPMGQYPGTQGPEREPQPFVGTSIGVEASDPQSPPKSGQRHM